MKTYFRVIVFAICTVCSGEAFANFAYVANSGSGTVTQIDTSTQLTHNLFTVGSGPTGIAVTPDGTFVYVTNANSNTVSFINTGTLAVGTITTGIHLHPVGVAITPDGLTAYVVNENSNNVSVIDTSTNTVTATISVGNGPEGIAITPDGKSVYVTNVSDGTVSIIDTTMQSVVSTVGVGTLPTAVAISPDGQFALVTNASTISQINTSTLAVTTFNTTGGHGIAITPDGTVAYIPDQGPEVVVMNAQTGQIITTLFFPSAVFLGVAITPDGQSAFVTNSGGSTVFVIDTTTNTFTNQLAVGTAPKGIAISSLSVSFTPSSGFVGSSVTFDATVSGGTGPYTFAWNFGDGTTGTGNPVSHTYSTAGTFEVQVTITDSLGNTGSTTQSITITLPVSQPAGLTGVQKVNDFGLVSERFNALSWQISSEVTGYFLYRNGTLIATLDGAANSYEDHNQTQMNQTYSLVAANGSYTSSPATIVIGGR